MEEKRVEALSDDMLDLVTGGADSVDERKQRLLDMIELAEQYKAAQDSDRKNKENPGSAGQHAVQNAMLQGLKNSQL